MRRAQIASVATRTFSFDTTVQRGSPELSVVEYAIEAGTRGILQGDKRVACGRNPTGVLHEAIAHETLAFCDLKWSTANLVQLMDLPDLSTGTCGIQRVSGLRLTRPVIQAQQTRRLSWGQPQARHLVEFRTYPLKQVWEIHAVLEKQGLGHLTISWQNANVSCAIASSTCETPRALPTIA